MRIKGLDFLRGIAILLVLFRHNIIGDNLLYHFGWLGVDLFFVLSGFLVSGLFFHEYKKKNSVNVKRFLIRRAFKIYPPFYFFALSTILFHWFSTHSMYSVNQILSEVLYVQSYFPSIWLHTWSLAVEEHFYITLAIFVFIIVKFKLITRPMFNILFLISLLVLSFVLRYDISFPHRLDATFGFQQSHLRSDGIIIGVLISYLYRFTNFNQFFVRYKYLFLILGTILIVPGFVFKAGSFFMNTWGLSSVNLGFGIFTLLSVNTAIFTKKWNRIPTAIVTFIGIHSYSIYLWHMNANEISEVIFGTHKWLVSISFFIFSIFLGAFFSIVIEKPFLRLRDRIT